MLLALSGGQKAGILAMAAIFIAFAVASSILLPRRDPDFPGSRGLRGFVAVTIVLFVAMLGSIVFLAKEDEAAGGHEEAVATETTPGETQAGPPAEPEPPAATTEPGGAGDPAAGERVFASAGCGGCHRLEAAGAAGTIGPNLDQAKPDHDLVVDRVTNGQGVMPSFKGQLSEEDIENVAAFVVASTSG